MNFFKRAWLNVWAKKGRSILLILVSSAILMFVLTGLLIRSAAVKATNQAKEEVGATVTLSANRQAAFKKMQSSSSSSKSSRPKLTLTPVKLSDATKIAKLSNISSYNVTSSTSVNASSYDTVSTSSGMGGNSSSGGPGGGMKSSTSSGDTQIDGVTATSLTSVFSDSQSKITKGRGITTADKNTNHVVVEKELASQNDLSVGDTITVKKTTGSKSKVKLKIVGIYKASATSSSSSPMSTDTSNTMYTSYTLANTFKGNKYAGTADSVTFNVKNPAKVSSVKTAGKKLINTSKYALSTDDSSYQTVKASMDNVESFANKIVWLVAIAGTIILALIVILMIRERRFEIGVLLSLGEARWKIIAQFFTEMLMVIVIAVAIAGAGGKFVGDQLGSQLVSQSTTTTQTSTSSSTGQPGGGGQPGGSGSGMKGGNGGPGNVGQSSSATKQADADLNISVSAVDLAELGGFGLAITFLSIMIASGGILRLEPKKVLIS
ncbi:ABC transporter permease [Levilactobacillus brevis]|uniref:ABC transporter permease n=1 Tax=Levilactobacillus TaxID=2767886 RepID=UPI000FF3546F|nr:ABC transporter permease [Levilactobacillus brevis]MBL3535969.1 ABC transporter permease [Lactobacillus sp. GPR40-2]MBL3629243.1 ABC transporter permease [Lactobacillus sp. GPB7-4]MCB5231534.1 ABC transporter permease [Levilactobacillus brevis]MCS8596376.1 ABC transporter permease [Levilactobacillus brevis]MCT3563833.1 ABC transporter permease [Levilactobacillus brevis]